MCVCVHIYLKKADTCRHAFSRFFSHCFVHILQCWVLGSLCFRKIPKSLKNPNQFNLEGKTIVMTSVSPFCGMLHVVPGLLIREQLIL